jgi:Holliday junction resolvase RusA-like endonuclease
MEVTILGNPIPKARPRVTRNRGTYNPQKKIMDRVRKEIMAQWEGKPFEGAVRVNLWFHMPIPKSYSKKKRQLISAGTIYHTKKPDIDNLAKFTLDCMTGIAFIDDSQIIELNAFKLYANDPVTHAYIWEC